MQDIRLIATDMDHTLLTEKGQLPPQMGSYIDRLTDAGILFAIASGRPIYTLRKLFAASKEKMAFICDNGGSIYLHGQNIYKSLIPVKEYQEMVGYVLDDTDGRPIVCGLDAAYIPKEDARFVPVYKTFYANVKLVDDIRHLDVEANKFTIYFPNLDSEKQYKDVFGPAFGNRYSVAVSDNDWIDIMNFGVDKGRGMRMLGKELGIKANQMMAFGDSFNDVEMLQTVKYSYRVGNANPGIYQYADYVTGNNDDYGVLQVIKQVLAAQRRG